MNIKMFNVGILDTNCYIVSSSEKNEALIIDPGFNTDVEGQRLLREVDSNGFRLKYIINTHGHPDHSSGNAFIQRETGASIMIHEYDAPMLTGNGKDLARLFGFRNLPSHADVLLHNGDVIKFNKDFLKVLHTPGHSRGSISLLVDEVVFTGDTLFAGSIGRYDLQGGSFKEIINSIKKELIVLPEQTVVYPGHGPISTIVEEKNRNPFLKFVK